MTLSCHCPETGHRMDCGYYEPPRRTVTEDHPEIKKMQDEIDLASVGAQGFLILKGALDEGATLIQAMLVLAAWFKAVGTQDTEEEKDD